MYEQSPSKTVDSARRVALRSFPRMTTSASATFVTERAPKVIWLSVRNAGTEAIAPYTNPGSHFAFATQMTLVRV